MRNFIAGLVVAGLVMCAQAPAAGQQDAQKHVKKNTVQQTAATYACPMHPEVTGTKDGKCTKCGMALEKKLQKPAMMKKAEMKHEEKGTCAGCCEDSTGSK
jgi:hypothetical protein